jgi:hypothetical protein
MSRSDPCHSERLSAPLAGMRIFAKLAPWLCGGHVWKLRAAPRPTASGRPLQLRCPLVRLMSILDSCSWPARSLNTHVRPLTIQSYRAFALNSVNQMNRIQLLVLSLSQRFHDMVNKTAQFKCHLTLSGVEQVDRPGRAFIFGEYLNQPARREVSCKGMFVA